MKLSGGLTINNLKDYRQKELQYYIVANIFIYIVIVFTEKNGIAVTKIQFSEDLFSILFMFLSSGALSIFAVLLDSMLPKALKSNLLYLFGFIPLPGETIFSKGSSKKISKRFALSTFKNKYIEIIKEIEKMEEDKLSYTEKDIYEFQNETWYKIYNKFRGNSMVYYANRDSLLTRDIFIISLCGFVLYIVFSTILKIMPWSWKYLAFLFGMIIISFFAAHATAKKFVHDVITVDIVTKDEGEK